MSEQFRIGATARRSGVPVRTIRFCEGAGIAPVPARSEAGYRLYTSTDIRRLRLARRVRLLGMSLAEVKALVEQAFTSDCSACVQELAVRISVQRAQIERQIADLQALRTELDELDEHLRHALTHVAPGRRVAECGCCPLIDDERGGPER